MQIRALGPTLGAEVTDVDVRTMDAADFAALYAAWLSHNGVLVVRAQSLTEHEFIAYSEQMMQALQDENLKYQCCQKESSYRAI